MTRDGLLPRELTKTGSYGSSVRITVLVALLTAFAATVFPMSKLKEMVNRRDLTGLTWIRFVVWMTERFTNQRNLSRHPTKSHL
jgi:undecaprenyl pyrophosphate phosphatase UppP